jgi:hypothetical protein
MSACTGVYLRVGVGRLVSEKERGDVGLGVAV